jgi:hypothetical protein
VTGAGAVTLEPELAVPLDPDPDPLVPGDPDPEPLVPDDPDPEPLVPEELVVALEPVDVSVVLAPVVAVTTALCRDRTGSCPDASWMKITDQAATKTVATIATERRRISDARRLRARSRSATTRLPSCGVAGLAGWLGEGESGEERGGVMLYLSRAEDI